MSNAAGFSFFQPQFIDLHEFRHNWGWFLALGIILVILGVFALGASVLFTLASMVFFGWLLIIGGLIQTVQAFGQRRWGGFFLHVLSGLLAVVAGFIIVANPAASALMLTLLMALFFMVSGLFRIITAVAMRFPHWGWVFFTGCITLILGILIWQQWPVSGLWVIGLFIGIDLLVSGWSWIMLSLAARRLAP